MHNKGSAVPDPKGREAPPELESQFVMRLPVEPAKVLREILRSGMALKDRLSIKLENDMRHGEVRFDHWLLHTKVVDLPTILEALKTIDNKSFYKTSDICQMLLCKEEEDQTTDEESPVKKKKDPNKVDKKFLWPHGVTPPMKNVKRRRFRKTMKKKYVEAPEIEKEVKRLLRVDNEAVKVTYEVICEDEDNSKLSKVSSSGTIKDEKENTNDNAGTSSNIDLVAEHDIFGEAVSDSEDDDEDVNINVMELDDTSRISVDSRVSDSNSMQVAYSDRLASNNLSNSHLVTEFSKDMFPPENSGEAFQDTKPIKSEETLEEKATNLESFTSEFIIPEDSYTEPAGNIKQETVQEQLKSLHAELAELRQRRQQQEMEIANIENLKLRQRFQEIIDSLMQQEMQKLQEISSIEIT